MYSSLTTLNGPRRTNECLLAMDSFEAGARQVEAYDPPGCIAYAALLSTTAHCANSALFS
jgi:hypothetical protein